jgi:hypothetical protein
MQQKIVDILIVGAEDLQDLRLGEKKEILRRFFEFWIDHVLGSTATVIRMLLIYGG